MAWPHTITSEWFASVAIRSVLSLVVGSSSTSTSAFSAEYISVRLFCPLSTQVMLRSRVFDQFSSAGSSIGDTAWPGSPSRQCSGQIVCVKWSPSSSLLQYVSAHSRMSGWRAIHLPLSTSAAVISVKASGDSPSALVQKQPCAMCIRWCVSSVTTTRSILSPSFSRMLLIRVESAPAPLTSSAPSSWKSTWGSMISRQMPSFASSFSGTPFSTEAAPILGWLVCPRNANAFSFKLICKVSSLIWSLPLEHVSANRSTSAFSRSII